MNQYNRDDTEKMYLVTDE